MSGTAVGVDSAVAERPEPAVAEPRAEDPAVVRAGKRMPTLPGRPAGPAEPGAPWVGDPYAHALRTGRGPLFLRRLPHPDRPDRPNHPDGFGGFDEEHMLPLDMERWCAPPDAADMSVLHRCTGPVLDVGCGPGRMVAALAARGVPALGVDLSRDAVKRTRRSGGAAVRRSAFDRLPGEGRWGTVLLMDGNIGIGGDPAALLRRMRELVAPGGRLLAEAAPQDVDQRLTVHVEDTHGHHGRPFPWARLGTTALLDAADSAGWILTGRWTAEGRPFAELRRRRAHHPDAQPPITERSHHS
ncbi:class I SAM-dependent DNA methyltransferase [Streptomyces luteireticuli]|uniref:Class I SAM-dependent methyltransferase n=1 Tax=Streptomyces luteireticuli TaxID=173858 RepID=A0ABP3IR83_9ACTN